MLLIFSCCLLLFHETRSTSLTQVLEDEGVTNLDTTCQVMEVLSDGSFQHIIRKNSIVLDKSLLITALGEKGGQVNIITSPRRWGKTTNLRMIAEFYKIPIDKNNTRMEIKDSFAYKYFVNGQVEINGNTKKFRKPPLISESKKFIEDNLGRFPVIELTISFSNRDPFISLTNCMRDAFLEYDYIIDEWKKMPNPITKIKTLIVQFESFMKTGEGLENSLRLLCQIVYFYYDKTPVVVLIDEYESVARKVYLEPEKSDDIEKLKIAIRIMRDIYTNALKLNTYYLKFAILTGILRMKEVTGLSGLNGVREFHYVSHDNLYPYYGVTVEEFNGMGKLRNIDSETLTTAKLWYDGYHLLGKEEKYFSIFSILEFINQKKVQSYWENSGVPAKMFALRHKTNFMHVIDTLLGLERDGGGDNTFDIQYSQMLEMDISACGNIREYLLAGEVPPSFINNLLGILTTMGYFTATQCESAELSCTIKIPNIEISNRMYKWRDSYFQSVSGDGYLKFKDVSKNAVNNLFHYHNASSISEQKKTLHDICQSFADLAGFYTKYSTTFHEFIAKYPTNIMGPRLSFNEQAVRYILSPIFLQLMFDRTLFLGIELEQLGLVPDDTLVSRNYITFIEYKCYAKSIDYAFNQSLRYPFVLHTFPATLRSEFNSVKVLAININSTTVDMKGCKIDMPEIEEAIAKVDNITVKDKKDEKKKLMETYFQRKYHREGIQSTIRIANVEAAEEHVKITPEISNILEDEFQKDQSLRDGRVANLMIKTKLSQSQIQNWFGKRKMKMKKENKAT